MGAPANSDARGRVSRGSPSQSTAQTDRLDFEHTPSARLGWVMCPELTIAEVAERTGLTRHTLRYYERDGLMPGVGNEDERLALLRAHRGRVRAQLDTMAACLQAIDMKISYYADAIDACES